MPLNNFNIIITDPQNPANRSNLQFQTPNQQYGLCGSGGPPLFKMDVLVNNLTLTSKECCVNPGSNTLTCSVVAPQQPSTRL